MNESAEGLREDFRRVAWCDYATVDAVAKLLGEREIVVLAGRLGDVATHLASRAGQDQPDAPPGTVPGAGAERIDLTADWGSVTVAGWFVRNTLQRWWWNDVLFDAELVTYELTKAFVGAIEDRGSGEPSRITVRLRAVSANRLVIEVQDSPANTAVLAEATGLVSDYVSSVAVRSGLYRAGGRTIAWCELGRPEFTRWI